MSDAPELNQPADEAADAPQPLQSPPQQIGLMRLVLVLCGLILAVTGLFKFGQGMMQVFSGANQEIERLLKESEAEIQKAQEKLQAASPALQMLDTALNSEPLADIRANRGEELQAAADNFRAAAKIIREAAAKYTSVKDFNLTESGLLYVNAKSELCNAWAEVCELQGQIISAVLDDTIVDQQQLVAKVSDLIAQRTEAEQQLQQLSAELEKLAPADQKAE